jgi:serine/threonine-protein kinase RsbW
VIKDNVLYKVNHRFKSERKTLTQIEPLIYEIKNVVDIPEDKFYNILIAVTEAINNAIIHGNKSNPDKMIYVQITASDKEFLFSVEDEGYGFDPASLPDPRSAENLLKEHGRGVFLIKTLADNAFFEKNDKGAVVKMRFILKPVN